MTKAKRLKILRRDFKFFCVHGGFREPYKVLVDGNFLHAMIQAQLGTVTEEIPRLLGAACKLGVTKCVSTELRGLGAPFAGTAAAAKRFDHFRCGHVTQVPAAQCIREMVGEDNQEGVSVATQDPTLKEHLLKLPSGVPVFFATAYGVQLEPPTEKQKRRFAQLEAENLRVPAHEQPKAGSKAGGHEVKKKKGPKGVNPLAAKKKITKGATGVRSAVGGDDSEVLKKRRQRRKAKRPVDHGDGQ